MVPSLFLAHFLQKAPEKFWCELFFLGSRSFQGHFKVKCPYFYKTHVIYRPSVNIYVGL